MKRTKFTAAFMAALFTLSTLAISDDLSSLIDVDSPYNAADVSTGVSLVGGFSVYNGYMHSWNNDYNSSAGYRITNLSTGTITTIGQPSFDIASNGYGDAFGEYNSVTGTFYCGTYDNTDGGIYAYKDGEWTDMGTFYSLYGADFDGNGNVYLSGLNEIWNGSTGQDNIIAMLDTTGGSNHDVLIQADGNSAGVAVDNEGNVYYANYNGSTPTLYRWTAEQIESVRADLGNGEAGTEEDIYLTYDDATILTTLGGNGANGITVDEGGNVFISVNGSASELLMWNDSMATGESDNYELIATLDDSQSYAWFGDVEVDGDFLNGGIVYFQALYGGSSLATITATVPEPATICVLAGGAVAALLRKRRKG